VSANGSGLLIIERILRDRQGIWQEIVADQQLGRLTRTMLASSAAALACYGGVLGAFHSPLMALTSAVKLPLLFLVTLAICLPTLYLFNLVFGARLSVRQTLALVMVAITVTSMLAVAFAPISLFFLITAPDYGFFKVLNVAILSLSAIVGLRFLTSGMQVLNEHGLLAPPVRPRTPINDRPGVPAPPAQPYPQVAGQPGQQPAPVLVGVANGGGPGAPAPSAVPGAPAPAPAPAPAGGHQAVPYGGLPLPAHQLPARPAAERPASMTLLYVWILLFGFVGTQLAWTLRPFFGSPGMPFGLYRPIEGNFYAEILRTLGNLF
jgi:hypothetical protein